MAKLQIKDLDFREILISSYKELHLKEVQVVILLLIDSITKSEPLLITGALLEKKMNIDEHTIEEEMVDLMNKKFLSYESVNGMMVTSCKGTYDKVIKYVLSEDETTKQIEESDAYGRVLRKFESALKRSLSSLEIELVNSWFKDEVDEKMIIDAIEETSLKGNVTVKKVDRNLLKMLTSQDIAKEGYTTVDEKTKKDIEKTMEEISYNWVDNEK